MGSTDAVGVGAAVEDSTNGIQTTGKSNGDTGRILQSDVKSLATRGKKGTPEYDPGVPDQFLQHAEGKAIGRWVKELQRRGVIDENGRIVRPDLMPKEIEMEVAGQPPCSGTCDNAQGLQTVANRLGVKITVRHSGPDSPYVYKPGNRIRPGSETRR